MAPPATPSLCAQGGRGRETDVLSPSSSLSLMDPGELQLSQLLTGALAPGERTPALSFPPGLYSGAPALPAQSCSEQFCEPPPAGKWRMLLQNCWSPSLDCFRCSVAGAGSTFTPCFAVPHHLSALSKSRFGEQGKVGSREQAPSLSTYPVPKHPKEHLVIRTVNLGRELQVTSLKKKKEEKPERGGKKTRRHPAGRVIICSLSKN